MYVAGVDVGSTATKAVVLNDGKLAGKHVMPTGTDHVKTASACLDAAVRAAGDLISRDLAYVVSTGYGRAMVDIADKTVTEITCHARGARAFVESAHVVVDIGGQDSKVCNCTKPRTFPFPRSSLPRTPQHKPTASSAFVPISPQHREFPSPIQSDQDCLHRFTLPKPSRNRSNLLPSMISPKDLLSETNVSHTKAARTATRHAGANCSMP
jgi:hypothetical protein